VNLLGRIPQLDLTSKLRDAARLYRAASLGA
jgi:hypothetical protein